MISGFIKNLCLLLLLLPVTMQAQQTLAVGQVTDAATGAALANVNIYFKNTDKGTKSDDQGFFLIRGEGTATTLVFSCVGYKAKEYKLKIGEQVGLQVELKEMNTELEELFVFPGKNPANALMKQIRAAKSRNNVRATSTYSADSKEQTLVLLTKLQNASMSRRLFKQLAKASIDTTSNALTMPLFMVEKEYHSANKAKQLIVQNRFNSKPETERMLEQLSANLSADQNFYNNTLVLFDKEFISPLANAGNLAYNFYLVDSAQTDTGKEYQLDFRTRNNKYLAFDGSMWIDSATLALKKITASLPNQANINFVKNLQLNQVFKQLTNSSWVPDSASVAASLNHRISTDTADMPSTLFLKSSFSAQRTLYTASTNFAASSYDTDDLNAKLQTLNQTPIYRTAHWIADVLLTGYAKFGKIDIGRIQTMARITEPEGLSLSLPFRTNEDLWPNLSLGGSMGYGFRNHFVSYSAFAAAKLPFGSRNIAGLSYTDDYRSIDYDNNDFLLRENPLASGDEDISNTLFAFRSSARVGQRKEAAVWFSSDLNSDIETSVYYRWNTIYSAMSLPFTIGQEPLGFFHQNQLSLTARFSFGQRSYNDHLQRIYANTNMPVIYTIIEGGQFSVGEYVGNYAKFSAALKHNFNFGFGSWNYVLQSGVYVGNVPYPLLEIPYGSETRGYNIYQFSCMGYMEYAADKYVQLHNEWRFNGLLFNHIPLVKNFNLRELVTFKLFYGSLSPSHRKIIDYPLQLHAPSQPYMEAGVGLSNIFRVLTLQAVWRLTDLHYPGISKWGVRAGISVSF